MYIYFKLITYAKMHLLDDTDEAHDFQIFPCPTQ